MRFSFVTLRAYAKKYERFVSIGSVVAGFIWDSITLGRPDQLFNNLVFIAYLIISAGAIISLAAYKRKKKEAPYFILPIMQFAFGNLAGGTLVVYGQSGSFEGSILFFAVLLVFIFGNELARSYYARLSFHIAAWYFLLFGYIAIVLPILVGRVGDVVFIVSGFISMVIVALFLLLLRFIARERVILERKQNVALIGSIFILWNTLYFFNILPPVPLSITSLGIYHSVNRTAEGNYNLTYEAPEWYQNFYRNTSDVFTRVNGEPGYCFSSIYAPVRLSADIYHRWEQYDDKNKEWTTRSLVGYSVSGGRESGYRGYTLKNSIDPGRWRCSVETSDSAIIGRTTFFVKEGSPLLREKIE